MRIKFKYKTNFIFKFKDMMKQNFVILNEKFIKILIKRELYFETIKIRLN